MRKPLDIKTGEKYNRWTIIEEVEKINGNRYFKCLCDCGQIKNVRLKELRSSKSKSCGCLVSETQIKIRTTHGRYGTLEYKSWQSMKERCYNPKNNRYNLYGGRGIIVCQEWMKFENFYKDMGQRPQGTTIDRIDSNGNYELSNCRWSTITQQNNNRRNVKREYI